MGRGEGKKVSMGATHAPLPLSALVYIWPYHGSSRRRPSSEARVALTRSDVHRFRKSEHIRTLVYMPCPRSCELVCVSYVS